MSIFPVQDPRLYNPEDQSILGMMEDSYRDGITYSATAWSNSSYWQRFYAGDQSAYAELGYNGVIPTAKNKQFFFNRIRPIVSMMTGNQRKNRKSSIIIPQEAGDERTADQLTKILMWVDQREGVGETISDAFEGACISGMNFLHPWMDYRFDPINGDLRIDRLDLSEVMIDPFFKKHDLSDCNYVWRRSYLTRQDVLALLPDQSTEINGVNVMYASDGKFNYTPENRSINQSKLNVYDEYYYKTYRTQKLLVDTTTGGTYDWRSEFDANLDLMLSMFPQLTVVKSQVPTYNLAIVLNGVVMYNGAQPSGLTELPFVPVYSYYNPNLSNFSYRIQSVVSGLTDAQYLFNRRRTIELAMLESQISSGYKYKPGALVDPKSVFMSGEGRGLAIKDSANLADVEKIIPNGIDPSILQLSENLGREMERISGVSEEALGAAVDDKAGILAMLRASASLTTLQGLFDQLDRSQKLLARLKMKLIQFNFTPFKVERIIAEQPTEEFYNKNFSTYDAAVEDGFNTTTQRQQQFAQYLYMREAGIQISDAQMIKASTIQNKKELIEELEAKAKEASDLQQLQLQTTMHETEARTNLAKARAQADQGLYLERVSRINENEALAVQREAEAVRDENQALLNLVKAVKEIDSIDIEHIEKLLSMQNVIKQQEQAAKAEAQVNSQNIQGVQE